MYCGTLWCQGLLTSSVFLLDFGLSMRPISLIFHADDRLYQSLRRWFLKNFDKSKCAVGESKLRAWHRSLDLPISGARGGSRIVIGRFHFFPRLQHHKPPVHFQHYPKQNHVNQNTSTIHNHPINREIDQDAYVQRTSPSSTAPQRAGPPLTNIPDHPEGRRIGRPALKVLPQDSLTYKRCLLIVS